jgi:hypothetical protein
MSDRSSRFLSSLRRVRQSAATTYKSRRYISYGGYNILFARCHVWASALQDVIVPYVVLTRRDIHVMCDEGEDSYPTIVNGDEVRLISTRLTAQRWDDGTPCVHHVLVKSRSGCPTCRESSFKEVCPRFLSDRTAFDALRVRDARRQLRQD